MVVTLMRREKYETPPKSLTHLHGNHSLICLSLEVKMLNFWGKMTK